MKIIKKNNVEVLINVGNANSNTLNRLVFGSEFRPRSESDRERILSWRRTNSEQIVFCSNGYKFATINAESYVTKFSTDEDVPIWDTSSNGNLCLGRKDSEKLERDLKKLTETEIFHLGIGLKTLYDFGLGLNIGELNPFRYLAESDSNGFNLKNIIKLSLNQEKVYFQNLDMYLRKKSLNGANLSQISPFSRIYAKAYPKLETPLDIALGSVVHKCSRTENLFHFWSYGKVEKFNENPSLVWIDSEIKFVHSVLLDSKFKECKQCGNLKFQFNRITDDNFRNAVICFNGSIEVCNTCYESNLNDLTCNSIKRYNYTPRLNFHSFKGGSIKKSKEESKAIYYGWELELEGRFSDTNYQEIAYQINEDSNNYLFCKNDGSIGGNGGFEVVSHPATFNTIKNMDLKNMVLKHRDKMKGFYSKNCGMHIHINRNSFTDLQLFKFVLFLNEYDKFTKEISQRRKESEFYWCQLDKNLANYVKGKSSRKIKEIKSGVSNRRTNKKYVPCNDVNGENGRYSAVNMENPNTIEIRIFKSNMDESSFRKNIEFVDCLFWFCKENKPSNLTIENFVKFANVNKKDYSNLVKFLTRKGH